MKKRLASCFLQLLVHVVMLAFLLSVAAAENSRTVSSPQAEHDFGKLFPPALDPASSKSVERGGLRLPVRPEQLPSYPFRFVVRTVEIEELPNKARLISYNAPQVMGFYAIVLVEAGKVCDPPEKLGLAEVVAHAMRSGGAGTYSADQLDRELDRLGATLSVEVQRDYVRFDLFCLPDKAPAALRLLHSILSAPRFEPASVEREKALLIERLVRVEDDPAELSRQEFRKVIYGTTHPLARTPLPTDVARLKRQDVLDFYRRFYLPSATRMGVAAAETTQAVQLEKELLSAWSTQGGKAIIERGSVPSDLSPASKGVYLLPKNIEQVYIRIGHVGRPRNPADQPVVDVLNNIFGTGGLTSRLMQKVRTEHGLAYAVGGGIFEDVPAGVFATVGSTKANSAADAVAIMKEAIEGLLGTPPTSEELETAKRDAVFAFANKFSSPRETLMQYLSADLYGYPPDYISSYIAKVEAVTAQDVQAAARRYVHPEKVAVFVLGPPEVERSLTKRWGQVAKWKLSTSKSALTKNHKQ